ncbi:MAG: beta strand repeat-containing protein, partial [Blastocatellia bacterium]
MLTVVASITIVAALTAPAFMQGDKAPAAQPKVKQEAANARPQNPMPAARVKEPLVGAEAALDYAQPELDGQRSDLPAPPSAGNKLPVGKPAGPGKPIGLATATTCSGGGGLWSSPGTWSTGIVPTSADDVTIGSGCTVTIDTAAVALSVTIQNGGTLLFDATTARTLTVTQSVTVDSGGTFASAATGTVTTHVLSVGADLTNNGTLDFSTNGNTAGAGITFTGAANNTFGGTGATTDIRTLTINKGTSSASILEITTSNLTVQGTTTDGTPMALLTLTNGTLKVSGSFTMTARVFTATAYTIAATTGFWLNNPNFTVAGQTASPTNAGLLRISNGTFNVGTASGNSMGASAGAVFTIEGGTFNSTGRLQTTSTVTYNQSGGTVNVCTVGNASSSSGSFGFSSVSAVINMNGGTINLVQASTAATPIDYQFGGVANITGGTLNVGTAATATNFTFRIQGQIPAVVINNTTNNKTANLSAQGNVWGNLTINPGTTLNLNSQTLLMIGQTITNNGAISVTTTNTGSVNFAGGLGTGLAQTYQGIGTFGAAALRVASVSLQNAAGVTLTAGVSALNVNRINAFFGQFTNSNLIAIGAGDTTALIIQRGATGIAAQAGSLDVAPTFNIGSGGLTLVYSQGTALITTGPEIPATRSVLGIQIGNPLGVTLAGGALTATNTTSGLLLSSGALNTSAANLLTVSATTTGAISGGSAATYVNGPLVRNLPASLATGSTYTFPVGKGSFKMLELVNPTTNSGGTVTIQAEVFDADSGGSAGSGLSSINHTRYWSAAITAGAANFTNATVRLTEQATPGISAIGQSVTQAGAYDSIGGTVTPPTIGPSSSVTSLGFFVVGVLTGAPSMSGNFNTGSGGDFATLTAAVAALNSRILTGPVTITLTDSAYAGEAFPITINANAGSSSTNTITIKPAVGASPMISGSSASALIILNGADYVTIDGSNTVGGTSQDTTFTNTSAATTSAVIWAQTVGTADPATNNTIKNLNVIGNASMTTVAGIGFGSSTISATSVGTRNDNNRVQHNIISTSVFGIYSQGASSTNKNLGTVITGNQIGGSGANAVGRAGVYVGFEDGVQITNNIINGVTNASSTDCLGIALGSISISVTTFTTNDDVANATVTGNTITNIVKTDTFSAAGISMATNNYGTSRIANNFVYGIVGNGTSGDFCVGIFVGGSTGATIQVYYNSVSMTGGRDTGGASSQPSFALAILGSNPLVDVRNNALFNTQTAGAGGAGGAAGSYAIGFSSVAPFTNITSNFNDFFTSGASSHFAVIGGLTNLAGDQATLGALQAAMGKDANSLSSDPLFTSATNLHLQVTSPVLSVGTAIAAVTNDFDNDPRPASNPDIGADELVQATAGTIAGGTYYNVSANNNDMLSGDVTVTNMLTLNGKLSTAGNTLTLGCNASISGAGASNYIIGNLKKTYCSAGSFNYVVGTNNGFSPVTVNLTAGTFPADFTVKAVQGPQPNLGTPSLALQRYWTLTASGVTADLTFNYLDPTDIPVTANENNFVIFKYDGTFTQPGGSV